MSVHQVYTNISTRKYVFWPQNILKMRLLRVWGAHSTPPDPIAGLGGREGNEGREWKEDPPNKSGYGSGVLRLVSGPLHFHPFLDSFDF